MCVQPSPTLLTQKNKRNFSLSRVESALHQEDITAVVGFLASKRGRSVNEYKILVANTTGQLLSSQQPRRKVDLTKDDITLQHSAAK